MNKLDEELSPYKTYSAGHLLFLAKEAYKRTIDDKPKTAPGKSDAIIAIVFSASALEAFINELVDLAIEVPNEQGPESVRSFATLMKEVESSRGSIRLKFMLTKLVFSGSTYKKGEPPFQDMVHLFSVRNALVHLSPQEEFKTTSDGEFIRVKETNVTKALPQNILAKFDEGVPADWKARISTQATARWACDTAIDMVQSVLVTLPDGHFKRASMSVFGTTFQKLKYSMGEYKRPSLQRQRNH